MCRSEKNLLPDLTKSKGFSLAEVLGALVILTLASSSVLVVINRCVGSAADLKVKLQAFEVVRDNMEKVLTLSAVQEMVEYGTSEKYPGIEWQTVIETFHEPVSSKMWVRAVCSAEYTNTQGETQTVELTHWLTDLSEKQASEILEQNEKEQLLAPEQLIETTELAAEYAGVDVETIELWVKNGMNTTQSGFYITFELDLYSQSNGNPTIEGRNDVRKQYSSKPIREQVQQQPEQLDDSPEQQQDKSSEDVPNLDEMTFDEIIKWLNSTD